MCSFLVIAGFAQAQSNLQLAGVLRYKGSGSFNGSTPVTLTGNIVVPTGQIYKIESASANAGVFLNCQLAVDGQLVYSNNQAAYSTTPSLPVWLAAGTYSVTFTAAISSGTGTFTAVVSGLEFNLTN